MNDLFELDARKIVLAICGAALFIFVAMNVSHHVTSASEAKREADRRAAQLRAAEAAQRAVQRVPSPPIDFRGW